MSASEHVRRTHGARLVAVSRPTPRATHAPSACDRQALARRRGRGRARARLRPGRRHRPRQRGTPSARSRCSRSRCPLWSRHTLFGLDGHDDHLDHSTLDELWPLVLFVTFGTWLGLVTASIFDSTGSCGSVVAFWAVASVSIARPPRRRAVVRAPQRGYVQNTHRRRRRHRPARRAEARPASRARHPAGRVRRRRSEEHARRPRRRPGARHAGRHPQRRPRARVQRVVVAFSNDRHERAARAHPRLARPRRPGRRRPAPVRGGRAGGRRAHVEGLPLIGLPPVDARAPRARVKRGSTSSARARACSLLLARSSPTSRGGSSATRPGPSLPSDAARHEHARSSRLLKFRTMAVGRRRRAAPRLHRADHGRAGAPIAERPLQARPLGRGHAVRPLAAEDEPRRAAAAVNVLRGDMSLVGPRPCLPYETEFFAPHHFERFLCPPGMTGSGR